MTASPRLRLPDWDALIALLDDTGRAKGLLRGSTSRYQPLGRLCSLNPNVLRAVVVVDL